jgi:pyridoxal phosphate enzyme (YggS family)
LHSDVTMPGGGAATEARRAELTTRLAALQRRLVAACDAAGRARDDVTLIAVTKTFPASDVRLLAELGIGDVAENRDQEARDKAAACAPDVAPECAGLRWHFVGQLQRNKCRSVVRYADVVHSVDRLELAAALAEESAKRRDTPIDVLLQVSLDTVEGAADGPPRGGVAPADALALAAAVVSRRALRLRGVMGVAPRGGDPDEAFARLAEVSARLRSDHAEATWVSAGMSADLESAIRHGATHVRVGSDLLGNRSPMRGTVAR